MNSVSSEITDSKQFMSFTYSAIHQSGGSLATGRFTVSTGTIPKNGHIPSMGERPGEAVASGGLPAAGLVNSTLRVDLFLSWQVTILSAMGEEAVVSIKTPPTRRP